MVLRQRCASWYAEGGGFFGPEYLEEYAARIAPERTKEEVEFLVQIIQPREKARILDLACGHGRHAVELAHLGYKVVGVDINRFFLRKAKNASAKALVNSCYWAQSDIRYIPFESKFDLAVSFFTSLGYFEKEEDDRLVISQAERALLPGGRLVLDFLNREYIMRNFLEKDYSELPDGSTVLLKRCFDFATGHNYEKTTRIWKNGRKRETFSMLRMYTLVELIKMCTDQNLHFCKVYGDYQGGPLTLDSPRCILVTQKEE